jgi:FKBP-type peptidyl-prolyl cis-trans isomerase
MAKDPQRMFIIVIVIVFLLSTLAFTGVIIYSIIGDSAQDDTTQLDESQLQEIEEDTVQPEDSLQGTTLQGFEPITEPASEVEVVDIVEGSGEVVETGATVTAHYTGAYAVNGEIFESSKDSGQPFSSSLNDLIAGWQEGIPGMKEGGTRRLIIPGELAYGEAPEGYTPGEGARPLGTLVFDIELISID